MNIKVKRLDLRAQLPALGSEFAAGADLRALLDQPLSLFPHKTEMIKTGLAIEIPVGYAGLVCARSGLASKHGLAPANKIGVIDSDYRGEIIVSIHNHSDKEYTIEPFERIAQLLIVPCLSAAYEETDELSDTSRGDGGFGSSGKL